MGSDNNLCEWHLPRLEQPEVTETQHKRKNNQNTMQHQKQSRSYSFQHFADPSMYIDDYRKKHTLAHAASDWKPNEHHFPKKHHKEGEYHVPVQAQYIDIRFVGLVQQYIKQLARSYSMFQKKWQKHWSFSSTYTSRRGHFKFGVISYTHKTKTLSVRLSSWISSRCLKLLKCFANGFVGCK